MRNILLLLSALLMTAACGNRKMSEAELEQKLDSIRSLEMKKQLRLQGISLEEKSPFQMYYDSLQLQALPISYSFDYVTLLPGFRPVPIALVKFLDLEGRESPKAIALPETLGSRLVMLAADVDDGEYELWLYSLDNDCLPVDKLLIYEPSRFSDQQMKVDERDVYFSITSYQEINVMEYADDNDQKGQLCTYVVDESRQFVEKMQ